MQASTESLKTSCNGDSASKYSSVGGLITLPQSANEIASQEAPRVFDFFNFKDVFIECELPRTLVRLESGVCVDVDGKGHIAEPYTTGVNASIIRSPVRATVLLDLR